MVAKNADKLKQRRGHAKVAQDTIKNSEGFNRGRRSKMVLQIITVLE